MKLNFVWRGNNKKNQIFCNCPTSALKNQRGLLGKERNEQIFTVPTYGTVYYPDVKDESAAQQWRIYNDQMVCSNDLSTTHYMHYPNDDMCYCSYLLKDMEPDSYDSKCVVHN